MLTRNEKFQAVIAKLVGTASIHLADSSMTSDDWRMAIKYTPWFLGFGTDAWIKEVRSQTSDASIKSESFDSVTHHRLGLLREQIVLKGGVIEYLGKNELDAILKCPADYIRCIAATWAARVIPSNQVVDWVKFYREIIGREQVTDIVNVRLPEEHPEFQQLVVVDPSLSVNDVIEVFLKLYGANSVDASDCCLSNIVQSHPRQIEKNAYAIITCRSDAFRNHRGKSAQGVRDKGMRSQNLLEYLLWHMFHYWKNEERLDADEKTICAESQFPNHEVPIVYWDGRRKCLRIESQLKSWWHPEAGVRQIQLAK